VAALREQERQLYFFEEFRAVSAPCSMPAIGLRPSIRQTSLWSTLSARPIGKAHPSACTRCPCRPHGGIGRGGRAVDDRRRA
jgi:hypothetical protein